MLTYIQSLANNIRKQILSFALGKKIYVVGVEGHNGNLVCIFNQPVFLALHNISMSHLLKNNFKNILSSTNK